MTAAKVRREPLDTRRIQHIEQTRNTAMDLLREFDRQFIGGRTMSAHYYVSSAWLSAMRELLTRAEE